MKSAAIPTSFDASTAVEDFAGPGRKVERESRKGFGERALDRHIWVHVNGWVFSATWNFGTYCSGARPAGNCMELPDPSPPMSPNAEVAVWPEGSAKMMELDGDTVAGWISPAAFVAAIEAAERGDQAGIRAALVRTDEEE